ncbi:Dfp1/Him1, central region-domain-containing protein [Mycena galopus ATCC 62051]|nr:Dfp1/Him1, central region-domain-containing protein [Mycena galopus ATCC 62051]
MATLRRTHPPLKQARTVSGSKRPRSPDHILEVVPKRLKAVPSASREKEVDKDKARRHALRDQQGIEFREKYSRAFPGWTFYFDLDNILPENVSSIKLAQAKIRQLNGTIENFFSNSITHLITDQPVPSELPAAPAADKENDAPRHKFSKSPIKPKAPAADEFAPPAHDLVSKAKSFGNTKVWSMSKLHSVVDRCLDPPPASASAAAPSTSQRERTLSRLLQSEKLNGTSERDPTQKRHDFKYFNRNSYFMLVEDIRGELSTVAVQEYMIPKGREAGARVPWPVLHCHPHARGPFLPFDEKEKKRWEKTQRLEAEQAGEREKQQDKMLRAEAMRLKAEARLQACNQSGDLRRSVSMNNMHRRAKLDEQQFVDLEGDAADSANVSGYLPRGYMAASGNSVASPQRRVRRPQLAFRSSRPRCRRQKRGDGSAHELAGKTPDAQEESQYNTMRLPKRDEGSKPGYCECCRTKFEDFTQHIAGRKHRKFAVDDANFLQLDYTLARVKRRTVEEVEQKESDWVRKCSELHDSDEEEEAAHLHDTPSSDHEMFDETWVDLDS